MEMRSHRVVVPKTARYRTLGGIDGAIDEVWMLLHGYGQLAADFLEKARALARPGRLLVAPEALSRFYDEKHEHVGASWMTREAREDEIEDYIRYLDLVAAQVLTVAERSAVRLSLLGFSQGAATAARWAARGQEPIARLVLWGQPLPPEMDDASALSKLAAMRLTLVWGERDALFPVPARDEQRARLKRHGIPFVETTFDGGHRLDDATLVAIAEEKD